MQSFKCRPVRKSLCHLSEESEEFLDSQQTRSIDGCLLYLRLQHCLLGPSRHVMHEDSCRRRVGLGRILQGGSSILLEPTCSVKTRSSAQGNCSAKSLAGVVVDSSLSSLSSARGGEGLGVGGLGAGGSGQGRGLGRGRGGGGGGGLGRGRGAKGEGAGDISATLPYILHYHMVLRPEGTSHNKGTLSAAGQQIAAAALSFGDGHAQKDNCVHCGAKLLRRC